MSHEIATTNDNAWESGELGRDEEFVRRSPPEREQSLDSALELQPISIRLQKELIEQLKFIANYRGVGYQPMIRDLLGRWTQTEMFAIAAEMQRELQQEAQAKKRA
jgi:hypothetical protein